MDRLVPLLLAMAGATLGVGGCWVTRAEVEQKILQDPDPADEATGDTGDDEEPEG